MKLAVIADIHGNLPALDAVLAAVDAENVDKTWVLGDLAAHGGSPAECVTRIRERQTADEDNFQVIGGNTDRYLVNNSRMAKPAAKDADAYQEQVKQAKIESDMFDWARGELGWENYEFLAKRIGRELRLKVDDYGLVMGYHAVPGNDEYNITPDTPDEEALDSVIDRPLRLGLYGHIHRQVNRDLGRVRLVNPGSVGLSFESHGRAQFALLTAEDGTVDIDLREIDYDTDAATQALHDNNHPHPDAITSYYEKDA